MQKLSLLLPDLDQSDDLGMKLEIFGLYLIGIYASYLGKKKKKLRDRLGTRNTEILII